MKVAVPATANRSKTLAAAFCRACYVVLQMGSSPTLSDTSIMGRALSLARRGSGFAAPNPLVGAVIVKDSKIVGMGWHRGPGCSHAEVEAIKSAGDKVRGAVLYVTLEPCNHYGRTPPCVDAIIEAGISRVVLAMLDSNPKIKGGGVQRLQQEGIDVEVGVLEHKARELNIGWLHWLKRGRPFVLLKLAVSLDGRIATAGGDSKWISSRISRAHVHRLRRHVDALIVGAESVVCDEPRLTNRTGVGGQPLRVVIDSSLRTSPKSIVYKPLGLGSKGPNPIALVVTTTKASYQRRRAFELAGIDVLVLEDAQGRVDLEATLDALGERGIYSVMSEGGGELATSLIAQGLCNRMMLYHAPVLIGSDGVSFYKRLSVGSIVDSLHVNLIWSRRVGRDVLSLYDLNKSA